MALMRSICAIAEGARRRSRCPSARRSSGSRSRALAPERPRSAVLDLEFGQAGRLCGRRGVVEDISHEGLRALLRDQGVSFQRLKTFKESTDPDFEAKQARVLALYAIPDGHAEP